MTTRKEEEEENKVIVPMLDKSNFEDWEVKLNLRMMSLKWCYEFLTTGSCKFGMPTLNKPTPANAGTDYKPVVKEEYADEEGMEIYKEERAAAIKARIDYNTSIKAKAWATIYSKISLEIINQINIDVEYTKSLEAMDFVWLFKKAKQVATGEGAHSTCLEFIKLLQTKMEGGDWRSYFKRYLVAATKVKKRLASMSAAELIDIILNSIFIIGVLANDGSLLQTEINEILRKSQWPHYEDCISEWSVSLNASEHIQSASTNTDSGQVKAHVAKRGGQPPMKCLNCGVPGHGYRVCRVPKSTCSKCGGLHHESMHNTAVKIALKRRPPPDSPSALLSDAKYQGRTAYSAVLEEYDPNEDAYAEQDADIQILEARINSTKPSSKSVFDDNDEDEGEVYGYTTRVIDEDGTDIDTDVLANNANMDEEKGECAVLDSGATGHVLKKAVGCTKTTPCVGRYLRGATDDSIPITHTATHPVLGHVNIVPRCADNLISVSRLMRSGCKISGEGKYMHVMSKTGKECMRAELRHDGLFIVNLTSIAGLAARIPSPDTELNALEGLIEGDAILPTEPLPRIDYMRPLNAQEIKRAKEAQELHQVVGHPGDEALKHALNHGVWPNTVLTGRDVDNARTLFGPCPACSEGKITEAPNPTADEVPAHQVGELLVYDLAELHTKSIGGNTVMLYGRDVHSSYVLVSGLVSKHAQKVADAINCDIAFLKAYGHTVTGIMFDSEPTLRALENKFPGVHVFYSTPQQHNKRAERLKRELNEKVRTTRADCVLELPRSLDLELYCAAGNTINTLPNDQTGPHMTPYQVVTGMRPVPREFKTGSPVLAYTKDKNAPDVRGEWGLVLDLVPGTPNSYRLFMPQRLGIFVRKHIVPQPGYPREWNLPRRLSIVPPVQVRSVLDPVTAAEQYHRTQELKHLNELQRQAQRTAPPPAELTSVQPQAQQEEQAPTQQPAEPVNQGQPSQDSNQPTQESEHEQPRTPDPPQAQPHMSMAQRTAQRLADERQRQASQVTATRTTPAKGAPGADTHDRPKPVLPYRTRGQQRQAMGHEAIVDEEGTESFEPPNKEPGEPTVNAYRISLRQALHEGTEERRAMAKRAIKEELEQLLDINAFKFIRFDGVPAQHRDRIVNSHMFLKEKFKADGSFDRMKARLVAGGHLIDADSIGNTRAPTVQTTNVRLMLAISAIRKYTIMTADIKGAFLLAKIDESERQYLTLDKEVVHILLTLRPAMRQYIHTDGTMMVEVLVWLYGYPQSAERFYSHLSTTLLRRNFRCAMGDKCVFTRGNNNDMVIVCTHVDDILCVGRRGAVAKFKDDLVKDYQVNIQEGAKHSYIGIEIQQSNKGDIRISQSGYRRDVLQRFSEILSIGPVVTRTPCTDEIMGASEEGAEKIGKKKYAGIVMSLMFLARMTRPDLMFTCAMLATHCHDPDGNHGEMAARALRYLRYSGNMAIEYRFEHTADLQIRMYADASHASHPDAKGHMCIVTMFGSGMIDYECSKMKLTTLSSTESEHVALCSAATKAAWLTDMMTFMGMTTNGPIKVYQDNTSTIWLTANEGNFSRNKHVLIRRNYVKEQILERVIKVLYKPTTEMAADMGTKPLPERTLKRHMGTIGMVTLPDGITPESIQAAISETV
jgi:hypothetical protein